MGLNRCFRKRQPFFAHNFKRKSIRHSILSLQVASCPVRLCAVSWVNIAKSNKFPFPMILVWDRKWVIIARYSVEDHLIGCWVGRCTHFVSGRQTVGRPRERPMRTRRCFFTPFLGVRRPSRASGPSRTGRLMEWKSVFRGSHESSSWVLNSPLCLIIGESHYFPT